MAESEQGSSSFNPRSFRDRFFAAVERARSQDFNELVEELNISRELNSLRGRPDTVVVVDEDEGSNSSSVSSSTRHRSTPSSANVVTPSAGDASAPNPTPDAPNEEIEQNSDLRRELNRLTAITQNREFQQVWHILSKVFPFVLILFCKFLIDNFFILLNILFGVFIVSFCNSTLLSALGENRYYNILKATASVVVFLIVQFFIFGMDTITSMLSFTVDPVLGKAFFTTFCMILIADLFIKVLTAQIKIAVTAFPPYFLANKRQRRIFQWLEYSSLVFQFFIPVPQWCYFFSFPEATSKTNYSGYCLAIFYVLFKMFHFIHLGRGWFSSTRYVCRLISVGSKPSRAELDYQQQCTICYSDHDSPVKLSCGHIFCEECISTWLDKEHTCPMCRAVVAKEDNSWKSGASSLIPQVF